MKVPKYEAKLELKFCYKWIYLPSKEYKLSIKPTPKLYYLFWFSISCTCLVYMHKMISFSWHSNCFSTPRIVAISCNHISHQLSYCANNVNIHNVINTFPCLHGFCKMYYHACKTPNHLSTFLWILVGCKRKPLLISQSFMNYLNKTPPFWINFIYEKIVSWIHDYIHCEWHFCVFTSKAIYN